MNKLAAQPTSRAGSLPLVGGVLALDFCNTSSGRGTDALTEHLQTTPNLLTWARHAGLIDGTGEAQLQGRCEADPTLGPRLLARALALREAVYRLNAALAAGEGATQADIDTVASAHAACLSQGRLMMQDGAFGWTWSVAQDPETAILGPIAGSALATLMTADQTRLKRCEGHNCGWLFLDGTKSNNRRWCEMEPCGNRAKQKRRRGRLRDGT